MTSNLYERYTKAYVYQTNTEVFMMKKDLYILTYDHGGYVLWKDRVKPRLKELFQWLEKYPKLRIGLDYESFTFDIFGEEDPEINVLIKELLEKYPDRVGLGATTYGQPLALTISEESNVRQLVYAIRTNLRHFNKTPGVYCISEFALHNQTPQLINKCGYDAAVLRSHVMGYGYTKTFDSPWGKWKGKDGTVVPAVPTYDKMGRGFNCTTVDNWILSRWPADSDLYSLEDFEEMFSKYEPLLASRYDDLTQPIEELTAYVENKDNYKFILLEDIPAIYGEPKDELNTQDNDFHVQMPWGYCGNEIFNGCREGELQVIQGEKINALSRILGGKSLQNDSEEAWKYILAAEHHDVTICGLLDLSRRFIPLSLVSSEGVIKESLTHLVSRFADKECEKVFVYNPHSFPVKQWITISVSEELYTEEAPCRITKDGKGYTLHILCDVPPLTARTYSLTKGTFNEENILFSYNGEDGILKTPEYTVQLTENGIDYLEDNLSGRRIFDNCNGSIFRGYIEGTEQFSQGEWSVKTDNCSATALFEGNIGTVPFEFTMVFRKGEKRIDCRSSFKVKGEHIGRTDITQGKPVPLTVNGHHHEDKLCLDLNVCVDSSRTMHRDLPFALSQWNGALRKTEEYWYPDDKIILDEEVSPEESFNNTTYYHGIYWLGVRDDNGGVAIFNKGSMGCSLEGNDLRIPLIYSNPYLCGDRILNGTFCSDFAIYPFGAGETDCDIHREAMCYEYPLISAYVPCGNGDMDTFSVADISCNSGKVILTAMYPEDDHILLRFCNFSDEKDVAVLSPNIGSLTFETDLLGNKTAEIINNTLAFTPWEIKTVRIDL